MQDCILFTLVNKTNNSQAYEWHQKNAKAADGHIFPRDERYFKKLVDNYQVVCALSGDRFVGQAYFVYDHNLDNEAELGGVMVDREFRKLDIGSILMRFALGQMLIESPKVLDDGKKIITHVHAENNDPRNIITNDLGFSFRERKTYDAKDFPDLKANEKGEVEGDLYEIVLPNSLTLLAKWCKNWNQKLRDGRPAKIDLFDKVTLNDWAKGIYELASQYPRVAVGGNAP